MYSSLNNDRSRETHTALAVGIAVVIAGALDMLGEPPAPWHPVVWYGNLIRFLERMGASVNLTAQGGDVATSDLKGQYRSNNGCHVCGGDVGRGFTPLLRHRPSPSMYRSLLYGIVMLLLATPIAVLPALGVRALAQQVQEKLARHGYSLPGILSSALLQGVSLKPFFALRMLAEAGSTVRHALAQDDLPASRHALRSLVSRDCSQLTAELIAAAAIESLAENLSDSLVAPLFYYLLFGLPGAAAYRLFNTFDSMVGYHGRYEYLGKAAARLDDVLNFVPARLTALLIIVLAPVFGGKPRAAWRIWRRDARKTESPNAGHPMAAMAGALGVRLEKVDHYVLGEVRESVACGAGLVGAQSTLPVHLRQAEQMVWRIGSGVIALTVLLSLLKRMLKRRGKWSR